MVVPTKPTRTPKMRRDMANDRIALDQTGQTASALYQATLGVADDDLATLIAKQLAKAAIDKVDGTQTFDTDNFAQDFAGAQAIVQGTAPRDPLEGLLAVQMAAIHNATMDAAYKLRTTGNPQVAEAIDRRLNRLARTFTAQMEALKRHRTQGVQKVVVQHVNVSDGGQAVVTGELNGGGRREAIENGGQSHERDGMRLSECAAVFGAVETDKVPV